MTLKQRSFWLLLVGMLFGLAISIGSGVFAQKGQPEETLPWDDARLLAEVLERVRQEYVEPLQRSFFVSTESSSQEVSAEAWFAMQPPPSVE